MAAKKKIGITAGEDEDQNLPPLAKKLKEKLKLSGEVVTPAYYIKAGYPTGSRMLDLALGEQKGFPGGRVIEIFGPERSGKTTLALHAIANAQKKKKVCALVDLEKFDPTYASAIGVDCDDLNIFRANESGTALDIVCEAINLGADVTVIDSVAALVPHKELKGHMDDDTIGVVARHMAKALRKILDPAFENGQLVIFINQVRSEIGLFTAGLTTTGGKALRQFASTRISAKKSIAIRERSTEIKGKDPETGKEVVTGTKIIRKKMSDGVWAAARQIGQESKLTITKNKVACPEITIPVDIIFGKGIDQEVDTLNLAIHYNIITAAGGWLKFENEGSIIKAQDPYGLIDELIIAGAWDTMSNEVDKEWKKTGILLT